jgi:hypothetical protein
MDLDVPEEVFDVEELEVFEALEVGVVQSRALR